MREPVTVYRSPGIYLKADKNHDKPQLGDRLIKAVQSVISFNGVPYLQITSLATHSMSRKETLSKKERM